MSRLVEAVHEFAMDVRLGGISTMLDELCHRLVSDSAFIEFRFPHFLERCAPVMGARGLIGYDSRIVGCTLGGSKEILLGVRVPVTSVCPCSKAISDYGAHNQRAQIDMEATLCEAEEDLLWVDDLADLAESASSAPLYAVLKRPDERFVTMQAYDNPRFAEDMARDVLAKLAGHAAVEAARVVAAMKEMVERRCVAAGSYRAWPHVLWQLRHLNVRPPR
jgi:GTP cyclohydrolase IB